MVESRSRLSTSKAIRLRNLGLPVDALNDSLKNQLAQLDEDELAVISSIKAKLNSGLDEGLLDAATTVGGFVW